MIATVTTVFDALFIFMIGWVAATANGKKQMGVSVFMIIIMVMNLFCIWGRV